MSDFQAETIERCPHDAQNPYAQISRALIRDISISPECRWLLIYLLSNVDGWVIKTTQICDHVKDFIGRDRVLEVINEAISAGYMKKESFLKNNLTRFKYLISETPKFKKSFRCPEFQGPEFQGPENQGTLKKDSSPKKEHKKEYNKAPPSADASELCDYFINKLKERNSEFIVRDKEKWLSEIDKLLRIDKRDITKAKSLIDWASTHKWWKGACLSPAKLRKEFDTMLIQMGTGKEDETVRKNRAYTLQLKEKYPESFKNLTFDAKFVIHRAKGKEIPFSLSEDSFKEVLRQVFGG